MKDTILTLFSAGTNVMTTNGTVNAHTGESTQGGNLSDDVKTYYSDYLIDNAEPNLVHAQFGQPRPIPKNGGKSVEFRRYSSLPKSQTPLTEGVTPKGSSMEMSTLNTNVYQYGAYIELSDMLLLTALDNNVLEATKLLGSQAGRTVDSVIRDVLISSGTNVQYASGDVSARHDLCGGYETGNHYLTSDAVKRAARALKANNVEKIDGSYVAIIHPDVAYDLTNDPDWEKPKTYCDPKDLYSGEIGRIAGVRFVESTEAKIIEGDVLCEDTGLKYLNIASYSASSSEYTNNGAGVGSRYRFTVSDTISESDAQKLVGMYLQATDDENQTVERVKIVGADSASKSVFVESEPVGTYSEGDKLYAGNAGRNARDVYCTLVIGANAYGVIDIAGGGLEHIVKQLGSAGSSDPINQRATVGWKAAVAACVLAQEAMVRIETTSTFESGKN